MEKSKENKIKKDYVAGETYLYIQEKYNITRDSLANLIRNRKWKRKGKIKGLLNNKHAVGNKGGYGAKGNKNAVKTGEYETIYKEYLSEEEIKIWNKIEFDSKKNDLQEEYKLLVIRERRMLERIKKLNDKEKDLTIKSITKTKNQHIAYTFDGETTTTLAENTIETVQKIEEALTRVQEQKRKIIEALHRIDIEEKKMEFDKYIFETKQKEDNGNREGKIEDLMTLIKEGVEHGDY